MSNEENQLLVKAEPREYEVISLTARQREFISSLESYLISIDHAIGEHGKRIGAYLKNRETVAANKNSDEKQVEVPTLTAAGKTINDINSHLFTLSRMASKLMNDINDLTSRFEG